MKDWNKLLTGIIYVGQLGLDLMMPLLLCLGGAWYLNTKLGVGSWIYLIAFFLGLGSGAAAFMRFYNKVVMKGQEKKKKKKKQVRTSSKHI